MISSSFLVQEIKINTNNNSIGPSREWLNIVYTTQAKNKIRAFFNKIDKNENLKKGQELLAKELRKRKININDFYDNENIEKILNEFKFQNVDELHIAIGSNKVTLGQVINLVFNETTSKQEIILKKVQNNTNVKNKINKNDVIVDGIDDIKVNIASCCMPIPGDHIVGYITKGYGINIHRALCPNVFELNERLINVHWNDEIQNKYSTDIIVSAENDNNILLEIISKTSNNNIKIQSINSINARECFMYEIKILIDNIENLENFMNEIRLIPHIIKVERSVR